MRFYCFVFFFLILVVGKATGQSQAIKERRILIKELRDIIKNLNKDLKNLPWPRKSCCMVYDPYPRWDKKKCDALITPVKAEASKIKALSGPNVLTFLLKQQLCFVL